MAIATSALLQRALRPAEQAVLADTLTLLPGWKPQLAALASLRNAELCETGALTLLRGESNNGFALMLLDTIQGNTLWFQALSAHSNLVRTKDLARHYLFTDNELNEPVEITFGDDDEEAIISRNILNVCRRLGKRVNDESRLRDCASDRNSACAESSNDLVSADISMIPRKHGALLSPSARRRTLQSTSKSIPRVRHRDSAPPVMETPHVDNSNTSRRNTMESACQGKVESWLEHIPTLPNSPSDSPSVSSAPPHILVLPPSEDSVREADTNDRRWPSSSPRDCFASSSESLLVPGSAPIVQTENQSRQLHPSLLKSSSKTWKATICNKEYEIADVTNDITDDCEDVRNDEGGFGRILRGKLFGQVVALKQIKLSRDLAFSEKIKMIESKRYRKEVVMAMYCYGMRHQNIVEFKGVAISETLGACLVFPWMKNGNSHSYVKANNVPLFPIIHGALKGLAHLHRRGIVHGDVKAQNILISDDGTPLISDFGLASADAFDGEERSISILRAGNAQWKAPELYDDDRPRPTRMSDMWAFGMFVIEVFTRDLPFPGKGPGQIYLAIDRGDLPQRPASSECSDVLWDVIQCCWTKSANDRITAGHALNKLKGSIHSSVVA